MADGTEVPLSLWGGTDSELAPVDLPEGVSPDNQDGIFLPGEWLSRPCTHRILNPPLPNNATVMSEKTYFQANGNPINLILDSNGILWKEDPTLAPGVTVQIGTVKPGARMKAITADGGEFMAFHDGFHGVDVPRQYDGVNFDRLSQDGPGGAVIVADLVSVINITSITAPAAVNIALIAQAASINTIDTAAPHLLNVGDPYYLFVIAGSVFNGFYLVKQVVSPTRITSDAQAVATSAVTGNIQGCNVVVVTAAPHGLQLKGDFVTIQGNGSNNYNNNQLWTDPNGVQARNSPSWQTTVISPTSFTAAIIVPTAGAQGGGTCSIGGLISSGNHSIVELFLLRDNSITAPGPPATWLCGGNKQAVVSNLSIGPPNAIARILALTGSGGSRYFWIPDDVLAAVGSVNIADGARKTVIADNVTTSVILDFSDNTLFASQAIDITGNNLFALITLAPCLGIFFYALRLWVWGELNKVQRFLNMGFEGGTLAATPNVPLGWTVVGAGFTLVTANVDYGVGGNILGAGAGDRGEISQTAWQNSNRQLILSPNTFYTWWVWARVSVLGTGTFKAILSAASTGYVSTATININTLTLIGGFVHADFSLALPAVIPADLLLRILTTNQTAGQNLTYDENMPVFTLNPYRDSLYRASYVNNFAAFDGNTGNLGPTEDPTPILCASIIRGSMYFQTAERLHQTRDNGTTEPGAAPGWPVDEVAQVGAMSIDSMSPDTKGENWFMTLSNGASGLGLYIFDGAGPFKISQEYQKNFDALSQNARRSAWVVNDPVTRRCYMGVASGAAAQPNLMFVLDYRELDQPGQIGTSSAIHISFSGKMIASDLVRKWTRWNLTANCGALLSRGNGITQFVIGAGNGQNPGAANGFGNIYFFDAALLTDQDFGAMAPYYVTYFFVNHEMEQALQLGSHLKNFSYLTCRILGVGYLQITPLMNELTNTQRPIRAAVLTLTLKADIERRLGLELNGERCAFKIAVLPQGGQTDVKLDIQKLVVTISENLWPVRGPR